MPIFRVKSIKIYTGQKKLHEYVRGVRDKYEVCMVMVVMLVFVVIARTDGKGKTLKMLLASHRGLL